jgi:hypothetical protein
MKILKMVGIGFFFLHYYAVLLLALVKNILCFLWKAVTQSTGEKHHINPFNATHHHVFAHIGNRQVKQIKLFLTRDLSLTSIGLTLPMERRCPFGESGRKARRWINRILF